MTFIFTGQQGDVAYWGHDARGPRPFDFQGRFRRNHLRIFASTPPFAHNHNHSPDQWISPTSDAASELLFDITGFPLGGQLMY
jgi:hypothetical protein